MAHAGRKGPEYYIDRLKKVQMETDRMIELLEDVEEDRKKHTFPYVTPREINTMFVKREIKDYAALLIGAARSIYDFYVVERRKGDW